MSVVVAALAGAAAGGLAACRPEIGDQCILSTDCSTRGDRLCDTSQPAGYCTQFNCRKNSCPEEAHCVLFNAGIPGCGYDDRSGAYGSRSARSFCVVSCVTDQDCRSDYVCADPKLAPWSGLVLDDNQNVRTCLVRPIVEDGGVDGGPIVSRLPAPICGAVGPRVDPYDAAAPAVASDAAPDAPPLFFDAGKDAGDAGDPDGGDGGDGGG